MYLLDATVLSDILNKQPNVLGRLSTEILQDTILLYTPAAYFEIVRGLQKKQMKNKLYEFHVVLLPIFEKETILEIDWMQAAEFWVFAEQRGRQLSDMDLLLAAVAVRIGATIASSDKDFSP